MQVLMNMNGFPSVPAPPGAGVRGTAAVTANANNQAVFDTTVFPLNYLLSLGLTIAPIVVATASRPTTALYPGMQIFDGTLGYAIWRNATNSAWINASGTTV